MGLGEGRTQWECLILGAPVDQPYPSYFLNATQTTSPNSLAKTTELLRDAILIAKPVQQR